MWRAISWANCGLRKRGQLLATTHRARPLEYRQELVRRFTREALCLSWPTAHSGEWIGRGCQVTERYDVYSSRHDRHVMADSYFLNSVIVDSVFPLSEASAAHAMMEANKNTGKIVLDVAGKESDAKDELP